MPEIAALARLLPAIAILIDLRSTWLSLDKLLRTYVGDEPHRAILRGNTKRGQVSTIRSAILFADMRDSIGHTADLDAVEAVEVFNALFDCLVPPIEGRRGEVLKYMGDGLLAIFRDGDGGDAADRALAAGQAALEALRARNLLHPGEPPIEAGVALHYGEAAYGNVGSGVRLDFTVIGRDVGLTSRIANLNRPLGQPVLMSRDFAGRLHGPAAHVGAFAVRGFKDARRRVPARAARGRCTRTEPMRHERRRDRDRDALEPVPAASLRPPRRRRFRNVPLRIVLPNLVTLLSLCLGLTAIRYATEGRSSRPSSSSSRPRSSTASTAAWRGP